MNHTDNYSRIERKGPLLSEDLPLPEHIKRGLSAAGTCKDSRNVRERSAAADLSCFRRVIRGSMTVEAALVLPLFLFFFANILFFFEMIRLQSNMLAALHETGTEISEYAYFYRYGAEDLRNTAGVPAASEAQEGASEGTLPDAVLKGLEGFESLSGNTGAVSYGISALVSETYVRNRVNAFLGTEYLDHTCLEGGSGAVSYLRSSILAGEEGRDIVRLVADYRVKPLITLMAPSGFSLQSRYYGHAWVGYDPGGEESSGGQDPEELIVYITPTGTVYHRSRECTYLRPSVRAVNASSLRGLRNDAGGKYYPCEACRPSAAGTVYICSDGNRYHGSTACRSLKRTILEVPLSSVEDRMRACSKCGGNGIHE